MATLTGAIYIRSFVSSYDGRRAINVEHSQGWDGDSYFFEEGWFGTGNTYNTRVRMEVMGDLGTAANGSISGTITEMRLYIGSDQLATTITDLALDFSTLQTRMFSTSRGDSTQQVALYNSIEEQITTVVSVATENRTGNSAIYDRDNFRPKEYHLRDGDELTFYNTRYEPPREVEVFGSDGQEIVTFSTGTAPLPDNHVFDLSEPVWTIGELAVRHHDIEGVTISGARIYGLTVLGRNDVDDYIAIGSFTTGEDGHYVNGRGGNDFIRGSNRADTLVGGIGSDTIDGKNGSDLVFLNQGNDVFNDNDLGGTFGADTVNGGLGNDTINGGGGNDEFAGGGGFDLIFGGTGNDQIFGGDQNDTISAGEGADTVAGGNGRDLVYLNQGNDLFNDNAQSGTFGRDTVYGGNGRDTIEGGGGDDAFYGGNGNDLINARRGDDLVVGGTGADTINAGDGNDTVEGGNGRDRVLLGRDDDLFTDTSQNDINGRDTVFAGAGNDTVQGGGGDDRFFGEDGNDLITGGQGNDTLGGGNGMDTLNGGRGSDTLTGGTGADTFLFFASDAASGTDLVTDFALGTDVFELRGTTAGGVSVAYDSGANEVTISTGGNDLAVLRGPGDLSGFGVDDITFV